MGPRITCVKAALAVLEDAGTPLHVNEIVRRMLERGLWQTTGKTPAATVTARIGEDINARGQQSCFERVSSGTFAARSS